MRKHLSTVILMACTVLTPLPAHAGDQQVLQETTAPRKVFDAKTAMLDNGMQVVVIENHRAPVVTHMVWYKVGAADEPRGDGVSGAAHFLEHLMFKGSKAIPAGEFSKLVRGIGGEDNAFTGWDYTAFFQSVPATYLPHMMAFEADRMINLSLADKDIKSEREVIIEERRMRTDNDPETLFIEQLRAHLFTNTPYAEPVIGWRDEMPLLGRAQVMDYYKTWYTPANAILVVSGDTTLDEVMAAARKTYGLIPSHPVPDHIRPHVPDHPGDTRIILHSAEVRQPVLYKAWVAPSFAQDRKLSYALDLLSETLSGGAATKFYQTLVVERKKAVSVDLSYEGDSRGDGSIWLAATPAPGVSMDELEKAIDTVFRETVGNGVGEAEVAAAKTRIIDGALFARDSVAGPAMTIGQALTIGATLDEIETYPETIKSVTRADVQGAFDRYLHPDNPRHKPLTGILLPDENAGKRK